MSRGASDEILRVYELTVEMADRISTRRGSANQFYLAIETLLLGVPASLATFGGRVAKPLVLSSVLVVAAVVALLWWLQLRAYRDLNREKFRVIQGIEKTHLRIRPYVDEWAPLSDPTKRRWRERYLQLGVLERIVPLVFGTVDLAVAVIVWL